MSIPNLTYTQEKLNTVMSKLQTCMNSGGDLYYSGLQLGYCACNYKGYKNRCFRFFIYLQNWHQAANGDTTGYTNAGTLEGVNAIVLWQERNCRC